ncbi:DNA cytosine methyltransferase [Rhizobium sp.]|uniref:DNA cytosine methyltransferase n=1 Tax=Rhizobium sp. TaxID=391 RepID=UPI00289CC70C
MNHANDNHSGLTYLSVCSGIEAASVAWHPLGWRAVAYSEIEKFPSAVLKHHYPDVPNLGDFTKIDVRTLGRVDILAGGTPCQAFSVAGLRQSLADARGNLSLEFVRLAHELAANNGLRNVVWENVVGVLSTKDNAFGCFLAGLVGADSAIEPPRRGKWGGAGMVSGPKGTASWRVLDAQYFGVAQRRRRVIVVADFGNGADPAAVLFEQDGLRRHSPPSRKKGENVAGAAAGGTGSGGRGVARTGDTRGQNPVVGVEISAAISTGKGWWNESDVGAPLRAQETQKDSTVITYHPTIARCDATREGASQDYETTTMVAQQMYSIMPQNSGKDYKAKLTDVSQPLMASGPVGGNQGGDVICVTGPIAHTLKAEGSDASEDGTGRGTPIIAFSGQMSVPQVDINMSQTLQAKNPQAVAIGYLVRRLTPRECERLQGFPDDYTSIPWRKKPAEQCPDGPRYKALGNSWAVPKFAWLGKRLSVLLTANDNHNNLERAA